MPRNILTRMELVIKGKTYTLPIFMPDATHGSIKGVDSKDLEATGTKGLVTNTYHLITDNIVELVEKAGGIKKFMNFNGLVITDSGGFQAMSLVRKNKNNGKFTDNGVEFKNHSNGKKSLLTPEFCIETQIRLGSDIIMVLDDCTDPAENLKEQESSVERTIAWAKRCKTKFNELTANIEPNLRPMIFGIVQGGNEESLRKKCAHGLIEIGFDGFSYGGWPMMEGKLLTNILKYTAELLPDNLPKYAMGVGKPEDMQKCFEMGYNMFDCVIPTRDARHGRLYLSNYSTINLGNEKFKYDLSPMDPSCNCHACKHFSKAYLRHLFKVKEPAFYKLASVHNLTVFQKVVSGFK